MTPMIKRRIAQREWLLRGSDSFRESVRLYAADKIPSVIEFSMVATPLLRCLRGMYGTRSNYAAILLLLWDEFRDDVKDWWYGIRHRKEIREAIRDSESWDLDEA